MAANEIPFSTDEAFNDLTDKDKTAEISGYICWIKSAHSVGENQKYRLLKFTVTNGQKKVHCCIWGQTLIDIHQNDIIMNRKIHIDGAFCKISNISFAMENEGYVPFDLVIQPTTTLKYTGMFEIALPEPVVVVPTAVTFENINQAEGLITIDGFIKMKFATIPTRYQNANYGCGSITDGRFKLIVSITNFVVIENLQKGVAVNVVGIVDISNGILNVTCRDMTGITVREGVPAMSDAELLQGGKPLKRQAPAE